MIASDVGGQNCSGAICIEREPSARREDPIPLVLAVQDDMVEVMSLRSPIPD